MKGCIMGTEAGLALVIDPAKALTELKRFERGIDSAANSVTSFARNVKRDFDLIGNAAGFILKPLTAVVGVMAAAKASMLALGVASIGAAGDYEMFAQQLRTVIKTKEDADRAFKESLEFSVATPFTSDEIVKTRIALEAVGVRGSAAVKSVAEAAAGMGRNIMDVANAVKSMEVEPIRNLGIMMDELYSRGVDENFRKTTESFRKAQEELLEVFEEKFEGGIQKMAVTYKGLRSTLKDAVWDLRATFGEGFLDEGKLFVNDLIEGIGEFKETARAAGVEFGEALGRARVNLLAGFKVALDIAKEIGAVMQLDGGIGTVILEALKMGATILGEGILTAFEASVSLWRAIGTTIGEGLLKAIYQSNIPGAGLAREYAIGRNLPTDLAGLQEAAKKLGIPLTEPATAQLGRASSGASWGMFHVPTQQYTSAPDREKDASLLAGEITKAIAGLPIQDQLKWAQLDSVGGANVSAAMGEAKSTLTKGLDQFSAVTLTAVQEFRDKLTDLLGRESVDIPEAFRKYAAIIGQETQTYHARINAILQGDGGDELSFRFGNDLGAGGAAWLKQIQESQKQAQRQAQSEGVGDSVTGEYTKTLREQIDLAGRSRDEQERIVIVRQADIEARQRQKDLGLDEIGLVGAQREEIEQLIDQLHEVEKMRAIGDEIGNGFARGFHQAAMHARTFGDVLDYLKDATSQMIERIVWLTTFEPIAQGISGSFTKAFSPKASAMGNAFVDGRIQAFGLGGIVDRPTLFGYSGGVGVAGEAGTEGLLPLQRDGRGRLGVHTTGGGTVAPQVYLNIQNNSKGEVTAKTTDVRFDGQRLIVGVVVKDIAERGPIWKAMQQNR